MLTHANFLDQQDWFIAVMGDRTSVVRPTAMVRLAEMMRLAPSARILDVSNDNGHSAMRFADAFGAPVDAFCLPEQKLTVDGRSDYVSASAWESGIEQAGDESYEAVIALRGLHRAEDPQHLARQIRRILEPGGSLGVTQMVRTEGELPGLEPLMASVGCIGATWQEDTYAACLRSVGFTEVQTEQRDADLKRMIHEIRARIGAAKALNGSSELRIPEFDMDGMLRLTFLAEEALEEGEIGLKLMSARKPMG